MDDERDARVRVGVGDPYRGGPPAAWETVVEIPTPHAGASRRVPLALLLVSLVAAVAPHGSTLLACLGFVGLAVLLVLLRGRLGTSLRPRVGARITVDHRELIAQIEGVGDDGRQAMAAHVALRPGMRFVVDPVHTERGREMRMRLRKGDDILADVLAYPHDAAGAASSVGTGLARLEAVLAELAPRMEERVNAREVIDTGDEDEVAAAPFRGARSSTNEPR